MTESQWRKHANQVIATVVAANPGLPEKELRAKLSEAYPFGMRQYHPYQMWLSAVKEHFEPRAKERKVKTVAVSDGQLALNMEAENE